jgi:putative chitinase
VSQLTNIDEIEAQALRLLELVRALKAQAAEVASVIPTPAPPPPVPAHDDASYAFADYGKFYDFLRSNKMLGRKIVDTEFKGCDAILRACTRANWPVSFTAYALATAYLETAHTMQPIKEIGGTAYFTRMYDIQGARPAKARELGNLSPGDGAKYHGRGYVQLTGKKNYARMTQRLHDFGIDVDLVADPDLAMRPDIAAAVMVLGMREGLFTGRKLSDDLPLKGPAGLSQFVASRDIINGRDRQDDVASYAIDFQTGLQHGGYKIAA